MNLQRLRAISLFTVLLAACSAAAPSSDPTSQSSEALCGSGNKGCSPCVASASSPTGGTQTCFLCGGDSYTKNCIPPNPMIDATWSGTVWLWTPYGPTNGAFSIPVIFEQESGTWHIVVQSIWANLSVGVSLQPNTVGSGVVNGDSATLWLPITASADGLTESATLALSTDASISPPGTAPITVPAYSPASTLFQMVGQGSMGGGTAYAFFSGDITAWPL